MHMAGENPDRFCVCISQSTQHENSKAAILNEGRWNDGDIIRIQFMEGDESLQQRVRSTAERWVAPGMANLNFQFVDSGSADVRIRFEQGNGSWSYLGTICRQIPEDQPTMNYGWLTPDSPDDEVTRVVMHEFGHALGLIHEHQNPTGGIKWNEPAVIEDLSGPPNNWDLETIKVNVLNHYGPDVVTGTNVDPKSIMMYPIPKAWTLDGFSAGLNSDVSDTDVEFIQETYPGDTAAS
jgi:serralysin